MQTWLIPECQYEKCGKGNKADESRNIAFGLHVFVYNRNNPAPFASAGMLKGAMSAEVYAVMPIEVG